jgi:hypothetical protein
MIAALTGLPLASIARPQPGSWGQCRPAFAAWLAQHYHRLGETGVVRLFIRHGN